MFGFLTPKNIQVPDIKIIEPFAQDLLCKFKMMDFGPRSRAVKATTMIYSDFFFFFFFFFF